MSTKLARYAPITAVAGLLGYLCWPYLDEPVAAAKSPGTPKSVELPTALLSPPEAPGIDRDPFGNRNVGTKSPGKLTSPTKSTSVTKLTGPVSASTKPDSAPKPTASLTASVPSSLILNGTYIRGDHRIAVINDSLYSEGDRISPSLATVPNCSVARVDIDRVVLNLAGETAELLYPDPTTPLAESDSKAPGTGNPASTAPQKNRKPAVDKTMQADAQAGNEPKPTLEETPPPGPRSADALRPKAASDASGKTN